MRGFLRGEAQPTWADLELESLKIELRDRALAVAERETELDRWEQELDRREARLERQRDALRRRRLQVAKRLLRLRGRGSAPVPILNGDEPSLDEQLGKRAVEVSVEAEAPKPKQPA